MLDRLRVEVAPFVATIDDLLSGTDNCARDCSRDSFGSAGTGGIFSAWHTWAAENEAPNCEICSKMSGGRQPDSGRADPTWSWSTSSCSM